MMTHRFLGLILICFFSSCSTVSYLLQAGAGQMELLNRSRSLEVVLADERTPPRLKKLLKEVSLIKTFGENQGLKPTPNYSEYIQLDRPYVVWVVTACETLEFKSKTWGFPIVGSFNYLGWFSKEGAHQYADDLKKEGYDVDVRGASAYSTLGWFKDPILSTMIHRGKTSFGSLVNVILHESVHTTVYIEDQSFFNESLASFVADQMTQDYFSQMKGQSFFSDERKTLQAEYEKAILRSQKIRKRLNQAYLKLKTVYEADQSDEQKQSQKKKILDQLESEVQIGRPINNATLTQYKTYGSDDESFQKVYEKCDRNWTCFLDLMRKLERKDFGKEHTQNFSKVFQALNQQ